MKEEKNNFLFKLLCMTIFFNIWFPKAGIKLAGLPLTIGNIVFAVTFGFWIIKFIKDRKIKIVPIHLLVIFCFLYIVLKYLIIYANGLFKTNSISYVITLIIYPLILFITYDIVDSKEKMRKIIKIIYYGFFFLCFYSLLQYFVGIENCDIPGLTVNLTDYREMGELWYMQKSNGLDTTNAKIVSTYQNGNLFGIGIILIYPIVYGYLKNRESNKLLIISIILFLVCVFLSLSRACWLGAVLFIFFGIILEKEKNKGSFMRKVVIMALCIISIFVVFNYVPSIANRFFNTDKSEWISMSGRTEGLLNVLNSITRSGTIIGIIIGPYGVSYYSGLAYEMFPLAIFVQLGIIGMIFIYGIFIKCIIDMKSKNYISKSVKLALEIWLIVGIIECGYWLPPTALNIFFIIGLGYASKRIEREDENNEISNNNFRLSTNSSD